LSGFPAHCIATKRVAAGGWRFPPQTHRPAAQGITRDAMQDLTMLLFTVVFFGLAFLYVKACQKLR
jgi:hypothetical protein